MKLLNKLKTSLGLLARADFKGLTENLVLNLKRMRAASTGGRPFVHRRLGFEFACFPDKPESMDLYLKGGADDFELGLLRHWMRPGDNAVDVGANLGIYACAAGHASGASGRIVAIEPSHALADQIVQTAKFLSLGNVIVCETCAGEAEGVTEFFVASSEPTTGKQSIRVERGQEAGYAKVSVRMETVDRLVASHLKGGAPSFVKMDIEGAEVSALRGSGDLLKSPDGALWIIEINPSALRRFGCAAGDVPAFFPRERFERWLIPQHQPSGPPMIPRPLDAGERYADATFYNLIALPLEGQWSGRAPAVRGMLKSK
jgi:FkbM family methyltransferase